MEVVDESVKLWLSEITEIAFEADDILDKYQYEILRAEVTKTSPSEESPSKCQKKEQLMPKKEQVHVLNCICCNSDGKVSVSQGMVDKIKMILERFDEIAKDRDALHLRPDDGVRYSNNVTTFRSPSSSFMDGSTAYGRDLEKRDLIKLLLSEERHSSEGNFRVIPIVGMGGIGKTKLAQMVYNDPEISNHFQKRGWICVADDFDVKRLTKSIITEVTGRSSDNEELDYLQRVLHNNLIAKKFLLVLDDVWNDNPEKWDIIRAPLREAGNVKIIVTTRFEGVAVIMQTIPFYRLDYLSQQHSWLLFKQTSFGNKINIKNKILFGIGMQIAKKCKGLPLALKAIGASLCGVLDTRQWIDVLESELWELDQTQKLILPALKLSYNRMPANLRPCFLYCSLFPRGELLHRKELVMLWMAQGYLKTENKRLLSMEDIGNKYFDELKWRAFFDTTDDPEVVQIHDMIYDLARSISGEEFWTIAGKTDQSFCINHSKVRHVLSHLPVKFFSFRNIKSLRTLLDCGKLESCSSILPFLECQEHFSFIDYLRAIKLDIGPTSKLPDAIGNLKHLRYVEIRCSDIQCLPESICQLYNLQTLIIHASSNIKTLSIDLGKLINLRHLILGLNGIEKLPQSICQLHELRELKLECNKLDYLPFDLWKLSYLQELVLKCRSLRILPFTLGMLRNLRILDIRHTGIKRFQQDLHYLSSSQLTTLKLPETIRLSKVTENDV